MVRSNALLCRSRWCDPLARQGHLLEKLGGAKAGKRKRVNVPSGTELSLRRCGWRGPPGIWKKERGEGVSGMGGREPKGPTE